MEIVTGIFKSRRDAEDVVRDLRSLNIPADKIGLLTPDMTEQELAMKAHLTDTERSGPGVAMGAAVGGAIGAASGATLGLAAASLVVPGIGPVLAAGVIAAGLLGIAGAATGAVAGEVAEEALGAGLPHEDLFVYEEALRRRYSVVVAFIDDGDKVERGKEVMRQYASLDVDEIREEWWRDRREEERASYANEGGDFERDEKRYRKGFQAALSPKRRGKSYAEVEQELKDSYDRAELDTAFRRGYERGLRYQATVVETYKA